MVWVFGNLTLQKVTTMELLRSLSSELDRMNATLMFDATAFQAREALHEQHVASFVALLRAPVREALQDEGRSLVASQWIDDAERLMLQHFGPPTLNAVGRPVTGRAAEVDLAQQLRRAVVSVSDDEIEQHATGLARLLLSNWFGLLEHAMQDQQGDRLDLDSDALPKTAHLGAVLQGCAAYALPAASATAALRQYQTGLSVGSMTALSPTLFLLRSADGWHVSRRTKAAPEE